MPVIINDFEIVSAPPQQESASQSRQPDRQEGATPQLRPDDIERVLRRFVQRRLRLWAD